MAYIPKRDPVGSRTSIVTKYRHDGGWWAFILHRLTGIGLITYLFLHIYALTSLTKGRAAFNAEMMTFSSLPFKFLEWALGILVMFHAFNGIRIVIVDFGAGARKQKRLLGMAYGMTILVVVVFFFLIFQDNLFAK